MQYDGIGRPINFGDQQQVRASAAEAQRYGEAPNGRYMARNNAVLSTLQSNPGQTFNQLAQGGDGSQMGKALAGATQQWAQQQSQGATAASMPPRAASMPPRPASPFATQPPPQDPRAYLQAMQGQAQQMGQQQNMMQQRQMQGQQQMAQGTPFSLSLGAPGPQQPSQQGGPARMGQTLGQMGQQQAQAAQGQQGANQQQPTGAAASQLGQQYRQLSQQAAQASPNRGQPLGASMPQSTANQLGQSMQKLRGAFGRI